MDFDLVIIGSGPGGYKAAMVAGHLGVKVALVEQGLPGGTCLNQGCVPKKTLLHLASLLEDVNALAGRGLIGKVHGDFRAALAHKDDVVRGIRDGFPVWLRRLGVQVFQGHAHLQDPHHICIQPVHEGGHGPQTVSARRIIIATGASPREHPVCPTDGERIISSQDFMLRLDRLPDTVLCVGGGTIGSELGFLLHQFGAHVTIVDQAERLLARPGISERVSATLERKFKRLGIELRTGVSVQWTQVQQDGVRVGLDDGSERQYDCVLVAIGRRPSSDDLGLEQAGVAVTAEGYIVTNEYLETSVPGIYAVGDVKSGPMTANAALHDAKIAVTNAISGNSLYANYNRVPMVVDSALEIAVVGLTEERAEEAGFEPDVARVNFGGSSKARGRNDYEGFIEVVHDEETGQLLGGCVVGPEAGEQIHLLAAACQSERGLWFFTDMNYSHPSWTEELENAVSPYTSAFTRSGRELFRPGIYAAGSMLHAARTPPRLATPSHSDE
jgi:dihydrolipoamide dehydrogenase